MSNVKITDRMRTAASGFDAVSRGLLDAAGRMDAQRLFTPDDALYGLVRTAELSTVALRNLTARALKTRGGYADGCAAVPGFGVEEEKRWLKITAPALLPRAEARAGNDYLMRPLRNCLIRFQRETPIERFGSCAVCVVHGYDAELGPRRVPVFDSTETARYLDVIGSVFLDRGVRPECTVLQTSEPMDRDCTEFYLMRPETLALWASGHVKTHARKADVS